MPNALLWVHYGLYTRDAFVIVPNALGAIVAAWYLRVCYALAPSRARSWIDAVVVVCTAAVFAVASVATLVLDREAGQAALGWLGVVVLAAFYGSPLGACRA